MDSKDELKSRIREAIRDYAERSRQGPDRYRRRRNHKKQAKSWKDRLI